MLHISAKNWLVPVMRKLVKLTKHLLLQKRGPYDTRRDSSFVTVFHQLVL